MTKLENLMKIFNGNSTGQKKKKSKLKDRTFEIVQRQKRMKKNTCVNYGTSPGE